MATGQRYYLCKMLSGPHLGAEVRLAEGSYRVGRDDAADIVLEDQSMAAEHALLAIHPDGVCVEPLLGEVQIDRVPHKDVVKRLPFFTVLGLGTTYLAIGPEDAAWPALAPPPALPDASSSSVAAAASGQPEANRQTPAGAAPALAKPPSRRWYDRPWAALTVVLLLLALVPLAGPFGRVDPAQDVPARPPGPAEILAAAEAEVAEALAGVQVDGLRVAPDPRRERLLVEGWVATEAERKAVNERLAGLAAPVAPRVWSREGVMGGVTTALQALGRPLEAGWNGAGEVALTGYIPSASDLQRVVDLLQRDVAGLKGVRNAVMTDEAIEGWLGQRLAEAGLADALRVRRGEQALSVRGSLTPEQRQAFQEVAQDYAAGPGRFLGLEAQIVQAQVPPPPAGAGPAALAQPARLELRFFGTVRRRGRMTALVSRAGDPGLRRLVAGDLVDGWEVREVTRELLVLARATGDGNGEEQAVFVISGAAAQPATLRRVSATTGGLDRDGVPGPGAAAASAPRQQMLAADEPPPTPPVPRPRPARGEAR